MTSHPTLPDGYQAQPAWGFRDRTATRTFEFHRVYRTPDVHDWRGPSCQLDEQLSYWQELPAGRWLSYAQARRHSSGLTFARFSSARWMREHGHDHHGGTDDESES